MDIARYRFDRFTLDVADRRLRRDGEPVELSGRYLDALALLLAEAGTLVSKQRFLDEVWRGVPVTDEALTQCIATLRRQLGDDAGQPRFIETVPKHGYRFVAPVEPLGGGPRDAVERPRAWANAGLLAAAGTIGGAVAGLAGGLIYGFSGALQPLDAGIGATSILLVILALCTAVALIGAAGVSVGIAAARHAGGAGWPWSVAGGAAGGLVVGAVVKLLGLDAFNLLFGHSPADMTGAAEGALLGAAVGLAASLADRFGSLHRAAAVAALTGAAAGALVPLLGGRMMAGSLDLLARTFPGSRVRLDPVGAMFGEAGFGTVSQLVTGALEGALFSACVVGAMVAARQGDRLRIP